MYIIICRLRMSVIIHAHSHTHTNVHRFSDKNLSVISIVVPLPNGPLVAYTPQIFGLLALAVGAWGVAVSVNGNYDTLTGDDLISGAVLLLVSGIITVVVAVFGFCGAFGMWRPLLVIVSCYTAIYIYSRSFYCELLYCYIVDPFIVSCYTAFYCSKEPLVLC